MDDFKAGLLLLGLIVFGIIFAMCNPVAMVGVGERGVKVTLGKVSPQSYSEGIHFVTPFISKIKVMDVKTQKSNIRTQAFTKDIQQATLTYVVNYNLQPENVHKMYREVGKNYQDTILMPIVEGTIKDVIGGQQAQTLIGAREQVTKDILFKLQKELDKKYINVTDFQITNIGYSDVFEKAIEAKVTAEQEALKARNKTVQVQEEAKQKVISAEAEAKAIRVKAEALNRNKELVQLEMIKKWSGNLPTHVLGNSIPMFNIDK